MTTSYISTFLFFCICSTFLGCNRTQSQPTFSENYIIANKGKVRISIPEVQELVHILFAITDKGISDSDMINHDGIYYQNVIKHFAPHAKEAIVSSLNSDLKGGVFYGSRYSRLKMDACGFYFKGDSIVKDSTYSQLNWDNKNYIEPYIQRLEEFAVKTKFRAFYKQNQPYYDTLNYLMNIQMPVGKMWTWLEQRFSNKYDNYWITYSPLANGQQSTNHFEANNFKQCLMFLCGPFEDTLFSPIMQEALMSKVAFTEIDHNYVNPVSEKFKTEINEIFSNRNIWTAGKSSNSYKTAESVFNEYMTYAVYILYVKDNFEKGDFEKIYKRTVNQMINGRGFVKFNFFTDQLLNLYRTQNKSNQIQDLYPTLLLWAKQVIN